MSNVKWEGVYPAVLTPFTADDKLDFKTFELNTNAQLEAGVDGIILGGSLGEASTLTDVEKIDLLKEAKKIVAGKIPVLLNVCEQSTSVAVNAAKEAD
ncbi:MAG: dihydrodipicolinate synthase family protein, partial [Chitinophagaceae bacterium]